MPIAGVPRSTKDEHYLSSGRVADGACFGDGGGISFSHKAKLMGLLVDRKERRASGRPPPPLPSNLFEPEKTLLYPQGCYSLIRVADG